MPGLWLAPEHTTNFADIGLPLIGIHPADCPQPKGDVLRKQFQGIQNRSYRMPHRDTPWGTRAVGVTIKNRLLMH